jgi:cell division topological specificity factor
MEAMKKEILAVISKYVSIDDEKVDIALQQRERASLLVAEIPFIKTLEGIEQDDEDHPPKPQAQAQAQSQPHTTKPKTRSRAKPKDEPKDETTTTPE